MLEKLLVFFPSALDHRRIDPEHTPYLHSLTEKYPYTRIRNFPEVDLDPTLMTGLYPHEHKVWQVRLKQGHEISALSAIDSLPDIVTTTAQCLAHLVMGNYDLAAVPRWRRRRLEIFKMRYRNKVLENYLRINGFDTFFNVIGGSRCSFTFNRKLGDLARFTPEIYRNDIRFEFIETHGLDTTEHWFLDDRGKMIEAYNMIDSYIERLHDECGKRGITLLLLSDHGMELVTDSIDIRKIMANLGIGAGDATYYVEASKVRFWFHNDSARQKLLGYLSDVDSGTLLSYGDMHNYNVEFEDPIYGEYYYILNPGTIFFPNDYYHPVANLFLGITNKQTRPRLGNPMHRGYHGYLPHNDSEKGTFLLAHDGYLADRDEIRTIDVAPTIIDLLGYAQPSSMNGKSAFAPRI